jgi:hypothetical protein
MAIFLALTTFFPLAYAAQDDLEMISEHKTMTGADLLDIYGVQAMDLLDENSREVPTENERLLSENARLHAEIAQLRTENSRLRATAADFDSMLDAAENKKCRSHCAGSCDLPASWFDKTCKMSQDFFKTQTSRKFITPGNIVVNGHYCDTNTQQRFFCSSSRKNCDKCQGQYKAAGTPARHPTQRWSLYAGDGGWMGAVTCPCTDSHGNAMSEVDAVRVIGGQVAALGIPKKYLKPICKSFQNGIHDWRTITWNTKVMLSTVKMLRCWKAKCANASSVELQLQDGYGGGTEC